MRIQTLFRATVLTGLLALLGCASKVTESDKYPGFLKNYSDLKETKSAPGRTVLHWVDPSYNESKYDNIVYNSVMHYPVPKPTTQVGQQVLDQLLTYTNTELKTAIGQCRPLVTTPGPRSLIFRGAIIGVAIGKEGLQFYEVVPVVLLIAGMQMAAGRRIMGTNLYFEGKLIDAAANKPVTEVIRKGRGKDLNNESTPVTFEASKRVADDMTINASIFDASQKP